ncbi:uncharacterized protein LOC133176909 [Saccostrea echinata]|uniref:uncharacterized protein LOC133176909 n=1 Tax=Saccostrea echinata TaxID=191078 RepID=UPI002A7F1F24|nr:uncharacterized protein LOC133176909 [Saccostrea echinata]
MQMNEEIFQTLRKSYFCRVSYLIWKAQSEDMLFLVCLSVIVMLTEACEKPMCSIQNPVDVQCNMEMKDMINADDVEPRLCSDGVKITQHTMTRPIRQNSKESYINGTFIIHVTRGGRRHKYRTLFMEVKQQGQNTIRHFIHIQKREGMIRENMKVSLSCLPISRESPISVGIAGELNHAKKNDCEQENKRFRQTLLDFKENQLLTFSSKAQVWSKVKSSHRLKRSKLKKIKNEKNCTVDLTNKTVTHYWKKPTNTRIDKCGIIGVEGMIEGEWEEKDGMSYCITKYTTPNNYFSRIFYFKQNNKRYTAAPCHFVKENLEHNSASTLKIAALSERKDNALDETLIIVLALLLFGIVLLLLAIAGLVHSRKKRHRIPEPYPHERTNISESSEPTAMIITVDQYSRDISQLTSLLHSRKIKVVTAESSSQENMRSRHDWLEKTVSNSNHYIFIVNKQMDEIFKAKFNEPLKEKTEISSNWSTEYEGGACAYTIVLIRNEFIKSLTDSGSSRKSCHLVSFEEDDEMIVSQLKHKFSLFQCIKTHCYNLYSNKQFRYNAACRMINNIKKTEKSRDCRTTQQISSGNTHTVNDMDIESAFLSVNISSKHYFIPQSAIEDTDLGSDIDVTSDLLEK